MEKIVYHASTTRGLSVLEPRTSSHGKPYVYAAKDICLSLLFVQNAKKAYGDFTLQIGRNAETGKAYIFERYAGAYDDCYKGVSGSLYVLPATTFEQKTSFPDEVVSTSPVTRRYEFPLYEMSSHLRHLKNKGAIEIFSHNERPSFKPKDNEDLIHRAVIWSRKIGPEAMQSFKRLHPEEYKVVTQIFEDKSVRDAHIETWCKRYGGNSVRDEFDFYYPEYACEHPDRQRPHARAALITVRPIITFGVVT